MQTLAKFISNKTPKFNREVVEGFCYHRIRNTLSYIDNFIQYSCTSKTSTHLRYLGYSEVSPKDEIKFLFNKANKVIHDIAENDIYLVKYLFQYGNEETPREYYFYLPYLNKGNIMHMSGNKFLIMPTLSDKVISIGDKIIFINILTAKYSFTRNYFSVVVNDKYHRVPIISTILYKNQSKKLEDTTKAYNTVMHYLLANYGYTKTMQMLIGTVPKPVYDTTLTDDKVVFQTTGVVPKGYIQDKTSYKGSNIKFVVKKEDYTENMLYCIGNLFYILDNFLGRVTIDELDNTAIWRNLLGEIIHSGNHGAAYLHEKISAHFNDLNSNFDSITVGKLKDVGVEASTLMELLKIIFINFNNWIMNSESRSLYNNKTYEAESFILSHLTSRITRIVLDINKEELRINGQQLESKIVDKIFKKYFVTRAIFEIKKDKQYVTSIDYSGDHLYFKNTSMVVQQESDFINVNALDVNTSERKKVVASMATVGSLFYLSKKNPTPLIRANPFVNIDFRTGTVLPHPLFNDIIDQTDGLLSNIVLDDGIEDNYEFDKELVSEANSDRDSSSDSEDDSVDESVEASDSDEGE